MHAASAAIVGLLYFASGAAGLILQVVWTRLFSGVLGADALSIATVTGVFMAGLGLGAFAGGRVADRLRDPLRGYAAVEIAVALLALAVPAAVARAHRLLPDTDSFALLSLARLALSAAILIAPTTLMGASLPLLARFRLRHRHELGALGPRVGALYALNTAGAVAGALAAGFGLLPAVGMRATTWVAAGLDAAVGLAAFALSRAAARVPARAPSADVDAILDQVVDPPPPVPAPVRRAALCAFAISGAAAMASEVLWTRGLAMVIGSSVYAFTLVLAVVLFGLALGAAGGARAAARVPDPAAALALANLLAAAGGASTYLLLDRLPAAFLELLRRSDFSPGGILRLQLVLAAIAILPATLCSGATFPLTVRLCGRGLGTVGRDVGRAYACNTAGAIAGALAGGFLFLPLLGLRGGLIACLCASLGNAAALALAASGARRARVLAAAGAAALAAALAAGLPRWDLARLTLGAFRISVAREYLRDMRSPALLFYRDGLTTTVTVERWGKDHLSLKNNGKVDASTGGDMSTQILVGLVPVLLHPEYGERPLRVLLVGWASGVTAGAILQADPARLDVVEMERATVEASRLFEHVNHLALADRRVRLVIDDARALLRRSRERWDVIVSEPSNPWITGVSNLFTREYYALAREHLAPGGVLCSWAQIYEIAPERVRSIYRALSDVFPHAQALSPEDLSSDTLLVAGRGPLAIDLARLRRAFSAPKLHAELARAGLRGPHDVPAMLLLGPDELRAFVADARANTDDNGLVEFGAPIDLLAHRRYDGYVARFYAPDWPHGRLAGRVTGLGGPDDVAALVRALLRHGRRAEALRWRPRAGTDERLDRLIALTAHPEQDGDLPPRAAAAASAAAAPPVIDAPGDPLAPPRLPPGLSPADTERFAADVMRLDRRVRAGHHAQALAVIDAWPEGWTEDPGPDFRLLSGVLRYRAGAWRDAVETLAPLGEDRAYASRRPGLLYYLGRAHYANADFSKGTDALDRWLDARAAPPAPSPPAADRVR